MTVCACMCVCVYVNVCVCVCVCVLDIVPDNVRHVTNIEDVCVCMHSYA